MHGDEQVRVEPNDPDANGKWLFYVNFSQARFRASSHEEALRIVAAYFDWCIRAMKDRAAFEKGHGLPIEGSDPTVEHIAPIVSDLQSLSQYDGPGGEHVAHIDRFPD